MRVSRSSCAVLVTLATWASANAQCFTPNAEAFGTPQFDGAPGTINALLSFDGSLYVAGQFSRAGGVNAENIARWDGVQWSPVGSGVPGIVRDLIAVPGPAGATSLHGVGRCFVGDGVSSPLSRWDGSEWLPDPRFNGDAVDAHVYPTANGSLYLAGTFAIPNASPIRTRTSLVKLGASVESINVSGNVMRLTSMRFNNAEHLIAAGSFDVIHATNALDIAKYNGTAWTAFPSIPVGMRLNQVEALAKVAVNGATTTPTDQLWVSGYSTGTFIWTPNVANGTWQQAPGTAAFSLAPSVLYADTRVALFPRMLAAGPLFNFGGTRELAILENTTWTTVSPFASDSSLQSIYAITTYSPSPTANPPLIVAGQFDGLWQAPGTTSFAPLQRFDSIASFDTGVLSPFGAEQGVGVTTPGVRGIAYNPASDQLLVVGEFTDRDGRPQSGAIAQWRDGEWSTPDSGLIGVANRVVPYGLGFVTSGRFQVRGEPETTHAAFVSETGDISTTGAPTLGGNNSLVSGTIAGVERLFGDSQGAVREWSNGAWTNLPTLFGTVRGLRIQPDVVAGSDNTLYAFGLNLASGARPLVRLVNGAWQVVGDSSIGANSSISAILVAPTPSGARLHAFGQFFANSRLSSVAILQPNGSWTFTGLDLAPFVRQAGVLTIDSTPTVIGIGEFTSFDASSVPHYFYLARLTPTGWEQWGPAFNAPIRAMQIIDSPSGPRIVVAGDFTRIDQTNVRGFATLVPCPACIADVDASGGVDATDLGIFIGHFERGEDAADIDRSGGIDGSDLAVFLTAFEHGC